MLEKLLALDPETPPPIKQSPLDRLQGVGGPKGLGFAEGKSIAQIIGTIITGLLSLLGVIFLVLMIYAGFTWMTAQGDEKKVETARATIKNSVIGLALVLAAYGITRLVVSLLGQAV